MANGNDKLLKKIQALLAKANGTDNEHEAEIFLAGVERLLREHNLTMADLGTINEDDPVCGEKHACYWYASESWKSTLSNVVCMYFDCDSYFERVAQNKFTRTIVGRQSAVLTVQAMMPYIFAEVKRKAKAIPTSKSKAERAVGNALSLRINKLVNERKRANATKDAEYAATGNALVPVSEIESTIKLLAGCDLKQSKGRSISTTHTARDLANSISLSTQVSGRKQKAIA